MESDSTKQNGREARLDEVVTGYLKAAEAGQAPDQQELIARHPDLAAELTEFFADQDAVDHLAAPIRGTPAEAPTLTPNGKAAGPGMKVSYFGDYELLVEIDRG